MITSLPQYPSSLQKKKVKVGKLLTLRDVTFVKKQHVDPVAVAIRPLEGTLNR
jgi:hypothetical protein